MKSEAKPFVSGKRILFPQWGYRKTLVLGTFSCHWAAVAAFIRIHQPEFVSHHGDHLDDLKEEALLKPRLEAARQGG